MSPIAYTLPILSSEPIRYADQKNPLKQIIPLCLYNRLTQANQTLHGYTFHPYKTQTGNRYIDLFFRQIYRLKIRFFGAKVVTVKTKNNQTLFLKIKEVSRILKNPAIQEEADVTHLLMKFHLEGFIDQIQIEARQAGLFFDNKGRDDLAYLLTYIPYQRISELIEIEQNKSKLIHTLLIIGKSLRLKNLVDQIQEQSQQLKAPFEDKDREALTYLINYISCERIQELLKSQSFQNKRKLIQTLVSIGKELGGQSVKGNPLVYEYRIKYSGIILKSDESNSTTLKIRSKPYINQESENVYSFEMMDADILLSLPKGVHSLKIKAISNSALSTQALKRVHRGSKIVRHSVIAFKETLKGPSIPSDVKPEKVKEILNQKAKQCGAELISKDEITNLLKIIPSDYLIELLENEQGHLNNQRKLLNTFIRIGRTLGQSWPIFTPWRLIYRGVEKTSQKEAICFAFAINQHQIFICKGKDNNPLVIEGACKEVTDVVHLNDLKEFVRLKQKKEVKDPNSFYHQFIFENIKAESQLLKELQSIKNPYLVRPYECEIVTKNKSGDKKLVFLQCKYPGGGVQIRKAPIRQQLEFVTHLALGAASFHAKKLMHGDLKPQNVLFKGNYHSDIPIKAKVADLGEALPVGTEFQNRGTDEYLPPECLQRNGLVVDIQGQAHPKVDSFSLGVCLLEILVEAPLIRYGPIGLFTPLQLENFLKEMRALIRLKYVFFNRQEGQVKLAMFEVCLSLLHYTPQNRLSCLEAAAQFESIQKLFF